MKFFKLLLIIILLKSSNTNAQPYVELSYTPYSSMISCTMSSSIIGFYIGAQMRWGVWDGIIHHKNEATLGSFGITAGVLKSGIVVGAGLKTDMISGPDIYISPDLNVRFHPFVLLFHNKNVPVDMSISFDVSSKYPLLGLGFMYRIKNRRLNKYSKCHPYI